MMDRFGTWVFAHPQMKNTIFQEPATRALMEQAGIHFAADPAAADVLVANQARLIEELADQARPHQRLLLWTHEPRFWRDRRTRVTVAGREVRIISMYSGEIFTNNYYYSNIPQDDAGLAGGPSLRSRRVVCVARGFRPGGDAIEVDGKRIDLTRLRSEIALYGHEIGVVDIYGRHWPGGVSLGESRAGAWSLRKYEFLRPYSFNLCFENTCWPYYCSEKLWHAIYCGCLPIYYGQPSIYEDFPPGSFIDYADIGNPRDLFELVAEMSAEEYARRFASCVEVFRLAYTKGESARASAAEYVIPEIKRMCGGHGS
jgi:hypothetical protein